MNNNTIITGGRGFVGSHLRKLLPNAEIYDLIDDQDILHYDQLVAAMKGKDVVVHLAALISVNDSIAHPGTYYSTNVAGTDNVLRAAIEAGCKTVIFASSAAVYSPDNPYGLSKKIGEDLLKEYKDKIQTIGLRFFNIYGPGQNPEYAGVISKFIEFSQKGGPIHVTGDGQQTRDFISVTDITRIIANIVEIRETIDSGSVFEVGTGNAISINDLAQIFAKKHSVEVDHLPNANVGIVHSKAKNEALLTIIGEYTFVPLEQGLDELEKSL
jgi:UDP-glucose 4-epimerase